MLLISAGVLGALPLSGVVSPFLSSGNTAMIANFLVFAIILSISADGRHVARQKVGKPDLSVMPPQTLHESETLAQHLKLRNYVTSQDNWQLVGTPYIDEKSRATTDRPALKRALAAARAGKFDVLLVYRVDRLSRSIRGLSPP